MTKTRTESGDKLNELITRLRTNKLMTMEDIAYEIGCVDKTLYNWLAKADDPDKITLPTQTENLEAIRRLFEKNAPDLTDDYFDALAKDRARRNHKTSWKSMEAYEDNIKELTKIYREKLPPELYTDLDCHSFALYYDWLMDEWDALWYMVKMPGCTIFEALVHIHPEKSTIELAKTQERLSYACYNLKELGFTMESLSNDALYQGTKVTATIFDLYSGHNDAQKRYIKSVYRRRITALLGKPHDYMVGNANEIAHIAESLPDLIRDVMTACQSDETYTIPMSIQSRLILEDQETDNTPSLLEKIKYMIFLKDRAKNKQEPYDRFDNYQAVRSAIESLIIRHYNPEHFILSHIPSLLYKLFTAKVDKETRKIEVSLTPFGKNIYELII